MPTNLKRVSFYAEPELVEKLERWHAETGASISELVRRAVQNATSFRPKVTTDPQQGKMISFHPWEEVETRSVQPVLLGTRPEAK